MATSKASSFHLDAVVVELVALEDIAQRLMEHTQQNLEAGAAGAFRAKCDSFIKEGELQLLVETFVNGLQQVGPTSALKDMEARFSILFSLARHLPQEVLAVVVPRIAEVVLSLPPRPEDIEKDRSMRLGVLKNLYTVVEPKSLTRYGTLLTILQYALDHQIFSVWDGTSAMDVEEICKLWGTGDDGKLLEQKRTLYTKYCDLAQKKLDVVGPSMSEDDLRTEELKQHRFLVKLLELYEGSSPSGVTSAANPLLASVTSYASRAAVISIKYPLPGDMAVANTLQGTSLEGMSRGAAAVLKATQTQRTESANLTASASVVVNYEAVKFLEFIPECNMLYQLLFIFASKGLDEFVAFTKQHPDVLSNLKLSEESCLRNIRLLTLASLAAEHETVTYDTIASKLQVKNEEVETWVINGIVSKLIDAKMDQRNRTMVINRGSQRLLTDDQWAQVQTKLAQWKTNVRVLYKTIQQVRQEKLAPPQQQQQQHKGHHKGGHHQKGGHRGHHQKGGQFQQQHHQQQQQHYQ